MSLFGNNKDMSKPIRVENNGTVEITITHPKGEEWCFDIFEDKLGTFNNGLANCLSGGSNYLLVHDVDGDSFIFGRELLINSCIEIIK